MSRRGRQIEGRKNHGRRKNAKDNAAKKWRPQGNSAVRKTAKHLSEKKWRNKITRSKRHGEDSSSIQHTSKQVRQGLLRGAPRYTPLPSPFPHISDS